MTGKDLSHVERWWILIGASYALESIDWKHQAKGTQMVVLAADPRVPIRDMPSDTIRLGYLSVGETNRHESERAEHDPSLLIEENPDWAGVARVDLRDPRWQDRLLSQEVPRLLGMGFDGLMLDAIDVAPYLEQKDPARFAGSRQALRQWAAALRSRFPNAIVIANGTNALPDVAPYVDGYVVEGVFATYDFSRRLYRATTDPERDWKLAQIDAALAVAPRPVFTIEYADVGDLALAQWAERASAQRGFRPYVGVKDLNGLP
jgi:uncharacterized protein (TIGR01370 family)